MNFLKPQPTNLIYLSYGDEDFIMLLATDQLNNDILDKCSDNILFEYTSVKINDTSLIYVFKKHGKEFLHKGEKCYMLPNKSVDIIKKVFEIT